MNLPKYTAGNALYRTTNVYREYGDLSAMDITQMEMLYGQVQDLVVEPAGGISVGTGYFDYQTGKYLTKGGIVSHPVNICPGGGTLNDSNNCGECGNKCEGGYVCCNGNCCGGATGGEHGLGFGCCNLTNPDGTSTPTCVSVIQTDNGVPTLNGQPYDSANCGTCGNTCGPEADQACCNGICCGVGQACCNVDGINQCIDSTTNAHCGGCNPCPLGVECCGTYGYCCSPGETCCDDFCSDLQTDDYNCGRCGNRCKNGTACCNGTCTDIITDTNCGKCGHECKNGKHCKNGTCLCLDGQSSLNTTSNCGTCNNKCPKGDHCCNGACIDLKTNPGHCGDCGRRCPGRDVCFNGCCVNGKPPLNSNNPSITNYWLTNKDSCQNIKDLVVSFDVTQDLNAGNGFSFQLNAVPPPNSSQATNWMQYVFKTNGGGLDAQVQYWDAHFLPPPNSCITFSSNSDIGSYCCSNGDCCDSGGTCQTQIPFISFPSNTIPNGTSLSIALNTDDSNGNITGAIFRVYEENGNYTFLEVPIPETLQMPIQAFQFVAVGADNGHTAKFSSGEGTIKYDSGQELCVDGASISCPAGRVYNGATGETSNASYGLMNSCCGTELSQSLST